MVEPSKLVIRKLADWEDDDLALDLTRVNINSPVPGAVQYLYFFNNGYGASVIDWMNCGEIKGLMGVYYTSFEIAIFEWDTQSRRHEIGSLVYDTDITNDVLRVNYISEVQDILIRVKDLPNRY